MQREWLEVRFAQLQAELRTELADHKQDLHGVLRDHARTMAIAMVAMTISTWGVVLTALALH